jgi:hypothetical protein
MNYARPELLIIAAAASAIQGVGKEGSTVESFGPPPIHTTPAYQADE